MTVTVKEKTKNLLQISVADTGNGMKEEIQNNLFQTFGIRSSTTNSMRHGTGFGLEIALKLVSILGPVHKIHVKTGVNLGSKFTFLLYFNAKIQDI